MEHEFEEMEIHIEDTDISFDKIYKKEYVPKEYLEEIKKANLLIIPQENFKGEKELFFAENTRDFFEFCKENDNGIIVDIAIDDKNYQCLELHSAVIEISTVIVQCIVLPVVINMISSFLYEQVKKFHRSPDDTSAHVKIITEETRRKKTKKIVYKGPVSEIKDTLKEACKDLFSEE